MSTRSGKRIHRSMTPIEDNMNEKTVAVFQSERKTRRKKVKENTDLSIKKRNNYVSYPGDDDTPSLTAATSEKPTRRTRQDTLKENNVDISGSIKANSDVSNNNHVKKPRKVQKHVKHKSITGKENIVITKEEAVKPTEDIRNKSKKKKTNKRSTEIADDKNDVFESLSENVRLKKKVGRKKKKSNSIVSNQPVVEEQIGASEVNVSLDSFKSAAGSPVNGGATEGDDKMSVNSIVRDSIKNATFDETDLRVLVNDKDMEINDMISVSVANINGHNSNNLDIVIDKTGDTSAGVNTTDENAGKRKRESGMKNNTFDKTDIKFDTDEVEVANATFDRDDANPQNSTFDKGSARKRKLSQITNTSAGSVKNLNGTFEINLRGTIPKTKPLDVTFDKDSNIDLNTSFNTVNKNLEISENDSEKCSLRSSDATVDITDDRSAPSSRISITSDDSKMENIMNLSPVLIESSIDDSHMSAGNNVTPKLDVQIPSTPSKREGTFTKNSPDTSPKSNEKTPTKSNCVSSPGCTPFPMSKSSQKEKIVLNVTRSIDKSSHRSSLAGTGPRQAKVMFCSPVNSGAVLSHMKGKVIKSNLKGSNKSFNFGNSGTAAAAGRKRSHTHDAHESRAKRTRLTRELQPEGRRPARPRTLSAAAKLPDSVTPSLKTATPSKPKAEVKVSRTKLPNFAALHQKQFAKMESLDECQERKARRARHLLTPTGSVALIERISPKGTPPNTVPTPAAAPATKEPATKCHTPSKPKLSTLEPPKASYTRFGFKLNTDVNPFSVTANRTDGRPRERRAAGAPQSQSTARVELPSLPSLAGATGRLDAARLAVMREKSFTEKRRVDRREARTAIKGVRTNRRFELQMKWRNINA